MAPSGAALWVSLAEPTVQPLGFLAEQGRSVRIAFNDALMPPVIAPTAR